jgi:hypothetical protein
MNICKQNNTMWTYDTLIRNQNFGNSKYDDKICKKIFPNIKKSATCEGCPLHQKLCKVNSPEDIGFAPDCEYCDYKFLCFTSSWHNE